MTRAEIQAEVETALMQVADNVAKHFTARDGWTPDDECFKIDLREAEERIMRLFPADGRRCQMFPNGEQCALPYGHPGGCK